ncbi:MAG: glycosyltransferase family 39 protein [Sphingobium sp.]|uniref:ArnT family glycosyltransferase n=1 Tax=Sphingobium sp. TaxID=1912891 RepID=UPI002E1DED03
MWHIDFGLPALNDPDEPLFVMNALDMLRERRLNPEWFGHPATILFYALALIIAAVGWVGTLLDQWPGAAGFASAVYADPSIVILPMRLFILLSGVGCIWLTWRIGREAAGPRVGLIAAALLGCNGLHVELSQVIRTDMLASLFMLWSSLHAIRAARTGAARDLVLAGLVVGLGGATKWPAMLFAINGGGAVLLRWREAGWRRSLLLLPIVPVVALIALLVASPYLLLDHATVMRDLSGEARPVHPGSTGGGFAQNMLWYGRHVLLSGFGIAGTTLAAIGLLLMPLRARMLAFAGLPGALLFLLGIAAQALIWERWTVPVLPWIALAVAVGLDAAIGWLRPAWRTVTLVAALALLLFPMLHATALRTTMRAHDTRQIASHWVRQHVPPQASLLIEDASFDLLDRPGAVLFPLGYAGCVNVRQILGSKPKYQQIGKERSGKAIVDVGNVAPERLAGCRADIAIITHYDRYRNEAARFPEQLVPYRQLLRGGRTLLVVRPQPGRIGGPVTRVVRLRQAAAR